MAPVTGTLTIDEKPYPGGKVIFSPTTKSENGIAGRASFGIADSEGRFSLSCYRRDDGAIIGEHSITLFRSPEHETARPDLKSLGFTRVAVSGGRVTVGPGENEINVALTTEEIQKRGNRL